MARGASRAKLGDGQITFVQHGRPLMEDVLNEALQPLFERQDAIELMFVGLAIALHESGSAPLPKTVEAIEFIRLFAEMTESPAVSEKFGPTLDRLREGPPV